MDKCALCGSKKFDEIIKTESWSIIKCINCGLAKTKNFSKLNYKKYHRDEDYEKFESHFRNIFRKRYNIISEFRNKPGKILDIGASTGTLLSIFKKNGWEVWGIEPSGSSKGAKEKGIKVINSTLERAKLPKDYFDVIVMNHVLEHMDNPLTALKKLKPSIKESGILFIDVPNFDSLPSKVLKQNWPLLIPQEHIHHFTRKTISELLSRAGYRVVHTESRSGIFEFSNPAEEILESLFTFKKRFFTNILKMPLDVLSTALDKGESMSVISKI